MRKNLALNPFMCGNNGVSKFLGDPSTSANGDNRFFKSAGVTPNDVERHSQEFARFLHDSYRMLHKQGAV